jgi:hypothetical protein
MLKDKIMGGWAGQTIGCTFGGPTEFKYRGSMIQDYTPIPWYEGYLKDTYANRPGLYDDIYMDLTFVEVFERQGPDAPVEAFANAFAHAEYSLWHANQMARYNILRGILPPASGYWLNNPEADDIDFQIEADFAGLMSPGMVNTASEICDKIGHIMNYGDGWYGGVFVAAMYSLAFISNDVNYIVTEALKTIPARSLYAKCISDVIAWHRQYPDDWKITWAKTQQKWSEDIGCPVGVFTSFNIDAKINGAWIVLGLLYGQGDFGKTLSISTRSGDDSDCNPASAGGILGTMLGYAAIPDYWKQGLAEVEDTDFRYTTISLNDAYQLSYKHALLQIKRNGGRVDDKSITIEVQTPEPVRFEQSFEGHYPVLRQNINQRFSDGLKFDFEGIGFTSTGGASKTGSSEHVFNVEMYIDGELVETSVLPTRHTTRKFIPFWRYNLQNGRHQIELKILNPVESAYIELNDLVVYSDKPKIPEF